MSSDDDRTAPIDLTKSDPVTRPIPVVAGRSVVPAAPPAQHGPAVEPGYGVATAPPPGAWGPQPSATAWAGPQVQTDQRPASAAVLIIAWVGAAFTVGYMLPWAIAATRGRSNQAAIGLLNLFLGWSFIGWVAALVMACQSHSVRVLAPVNVMVATQYVPPGYPTGQQPAPAPAGWYASPAGYGQEYWDGRAWTGHRAP
ncbi:superinfection immunity protein [Cellulomonas sp. PhB150]|uniref:superinfection immunity protein n=1 Tax=Cellulomonas sp. PhB150 TaxID=2485188 RepID=UPI000F4A7018|nr:superinfection immunity protein [Cellulomonas sp. PhB150]ROS30378.1 uncharacterized protein DUF2510 [Cellulomonas sp. PhB150]